MEGHMPMDHIHMCISIPPKYAVSEVARQFAGRQKNFKGERLWARGYAVSTVGFELDKVRDYIRHQEKLDHEEDTGRF